MDEFLIKNYRIRKLSEWEMQQLIGYGYSLGHTFRPGFGTIDNLYCIETLIKVPKKGSPPLETYIEDLLTVLRLFKPGSVCYRAILHYPKIWRTQWGMLLRPFPSITGPIYKLSMSDNESLNSLYELYANVKNQLSGNVKFAIRWFNKCYEDRDPIDKLVDLATAFEVFGTQSRLDLYVPWFLELKKEDRIKLYENIKELRKSRGAILHSDHSGETSTLVRLSTFYYSYLGCYFKINDCFVTSEKSKNIR